MGKHRIRIEQINGKLKILQNSCYTLL